MKTTLRHLAAWDKLDKHYGRLGPLSMSYELGFSEGRPVLLTNCNLGSGSRYKPTRTLTTRLGDIDSTEGDAHDAIP